MGILKYIEAVHNYDVDVGMFFLVVQRHIQSDTEFRKGCHVITYIPYIHILTYIHTVDTRILKHSTTLKTTVANNGVVFMGSYKGIASVCIKIIGHVAVKTKHNLGNEESLRKC